MQKQVAKKMRNIVKNHNPLELLATSAVYCLHNTTGPEADYQDNSPYSQAMIELLQSICLIYLFDEFQDSPVFHHSMFQALDLSKQCVSRFALKRMPTLAESNPIDRGRLMAIEGARLHTQQVRNWGYPKHMRQIERDLYLPLEAEYRSALGISPVEFLDLADNLSREACKRVLVIRKEIGDVLRERDLKKSVQNICVFAGLSQNIADTLYQNIYAKPGPDEHKRYHLAAYFHQFLVDAFYSPLKMQLKFCRLM